MPGTLRARSAVLLPLMLVVALTATMFTFTPTADAATRRQQKIGTGMDIVRHQKGDPYRYGAAGPNAFDCSGLIYYSYRRAGFRHIPRSSSAQAKHMNRIHKRALHRGDFVFFYDGRATPGNVYHVGVYAGRKNGHRMIIHAPYGNQRVHRERIWTRHWFAGTLRGL
ncbi:MAG TPA: C40 family peptidase [Nocardioidaceae bacterium]|nr:C40 family peptidase [Nocardioidaceae bacterium]